MNRPTSVTGDRPDGDCLHGDRSCLAVKRRELDFERLAVRVNVNHSAHIADFKAFSGNMITPCQDTRSRAAGRPHRYRGTARTRSVISMATDPEPVVEIPPAGAANSSL